MKNYGETFLKAFEVPHGGFTTLREVCDALNLNYRTATRYVNDAVECGDIVRGGRAKGGGKSQPMLYRRAGKHIPTLTDMREHDYANPVTYQPEVARDVTETPESALGLSARIHRLERDLAAHREVVTGKLDDLIRLLS